MSLPMTAVLLPLLCSVAHAGQSVATQSVATQSAATRATPEEIARAVEQLGDDSFAVRERASKLLWQAGRAAEPALAQAAKSRDPEVAARARRILHSFRWGIYPDTPEEIVRLISQFRHGNQVAKQAVLKKLMELKQMATVVALLGTEPDEKVRTVLVRELVKDLDKLVGGLFVDGNWQKVEQLLQIGAVNDVGMRHYAAYLLLRDRLDAKIAALNDRAAAAGPVQGRGAGPVQGNAKLLTYLLRAKGDLHAALVAAENSADATLTASILFELGDWRQLAEIYDKAGRDVAGNLAGGIVHLGYTAAYHRLAGNAGQYQEAVRGIIALADAKPNKIRYCAEALLVNDRFQDAIEMYRRQGGTEEFQILCRQHRFREALALAGVTDPRGAYSPWFTRPGPGSEIESGRTRGRFDLGLGVASVLYRLGEKQKAVRLFSELARAAVDDNNLSVRSVCELEYRLGLKDQAFEHAAMVLDSQWQLSILRTLFPERSAAAEIWWALLCRKRPEEARKTTLGRLREVLGPGCSDGSTSDGLTPGDWLKLIEEAEKAASELSPPQRGKWLSALGDACLARGKPRLARDYFQQAAEAAPAVTSSMHVADLFAEENQWQKAAEWYGRAWEADRTKPIALLLQGRALVQAGPSRAGPSQAGGESEGRKLIEAARLLPLGNAETRYALAKDLHDRGLEDEACVHWRLMVRTGEFQSLPVNEAAKHLANRAAGNDDLRAAAYWQWPLLRCLQTSSAIAGVEGYLEVAHLIHKARARGLLAAGKVDRAIAEMRLSRAALPGEVQLALDLVPPLQKAGRRPAAEELFGQVLAVNRRVCDDFPRAAGYHNNVAWLAARCNRQLDRALKHAAAAVALVPENAAYVDTLAEVHFRRGDRQKAIEFSKRCIELDPNEEHFRRQLERFQTPSP